MKEGKNKGKEETIKDGKMESEVDPGFVKGRQGGTALSQPIFGQIFLKTAWNWKLHWSIQWSARDTHPLPVQFVLILRSG